MFVFFFLSKIISKIENQGTSLATKQLRFCPSNAGGADLIPGRGAKIPYASQHGQNKCMNE